VVLVDRSERCVSHLNGFENFVELYFSGYMAIMSAKLLSEPRTNQGIEDDRESPFYVLLYLGLRYTKHNQVLQELESYMENSTT